MSHQNHNLNGRNKTLDYYTSATEYILKLRNDDHTNTVKLFIRVTIKAAGQGIYNDDPYTNRQ